MWDFLFNSIWAWAGLAGVIVIGCGVVAWFFPTLRVTAAAVAGAALTVAGAFAKGYSARAKIEQKRREEAVAKARAGYDKIDKRNDTPADVAKRLRDGSF